MVRGGRERRECGNGAARRSKEKGLVVGSGSHEEEDMRRKRKGKAGFGFHQPGIRIFFLPPHE
jgi:hypothetical protein